MGLGQSPDDTVISELHVDAQWFQGGNATWNFWRAAANFATTNDSMWAVSQGTWLRRAHIGGSLSLADSGWSSGGFMVSSCRKSATDYTTREPPLPGGGRSRAIEIAPWERRWRWPSTYVDGILATTQVVARRGSAVSAPISIGGWQGLGVKWIW